MSDVAMTRREALATVAAGAAVVSCGCLAGCQTEKEKPPLITSGVVSLGPASEFPAGGAYTRFVETYGIVVVNDSGTPLAIRPKCTHKGCTAKWNPKDAQFECPCHGSRFNLLGQPLQGPATRPLPAVPLQAQADGTVSVDLTKLYSL